MEAYEKDLIIDDFLMLEAARERIPAIVSKFWMPDNDCEEDMQYLAFGVGTSEKKVTHIREVIAEDVTDGQKIARHVFLNEGFSSELRLWFLGHCC